MNAITPITENTPSERLNESAEEALEKADARELYHHYKIAMQRCEKMVETLNVVAAHYTGKPDSPRYFPSESAVESMERVALAAIELAKSVVTKST